MWLAVLSSVILVHFKWSHDTWMWKWYNEAQNQKYIHVGHKHSHIPMSYCQFNYYAIVCGQIEEGTLKVEVGMLSVNS